MKAELLLKKLAVSKDCYFIIDSYFGTNANIKWNMSLLREHQQQ